MSVAQTVQSFAGIANENEFYGHHYLAEVFKGDIRALIESWQAVEEAATAAPTAEAGAPAAGAAAPAAGAAAPAADAKAKAKK